MARKKKDDVFQWDRTSLRVQSLGDGTALRIFDHLGHARKVDGSDVDPGKNLARLVADIRKADGDCADRIVSQLPDAWADRYLEHIADVEAEDTEAEDVEVVS
jgi:hypothetical protein